MRERGEGVDPSPGIVTQRQSQRHPTVPRDAATGHSSPLTGNPLTATHTGTPHGHPGTARPLGGCTTQPHSFTTPPHGDTWHSRPVTQRHTRTRCPTAAQCSDPHATQHTQPRGCADTHTHTHKAEDTRRLGTPGPLAGDGTPGHRDARMHPRILPLTRLGSTGAPKRSPPARTPPPPAHRTRNPQVQPRTLGAWARPGDTLGGQGPRAPRRGRGRPGGRGDGSQGAAPARRRARPPAGSKFKAPGGAAARSPPLSAAAIFR